MCILLWHSRLLGVYAQDHRFDAGEACQATRRFSCKCGGRVRTLVIDRDGVSVSEEACGGVFETAVFKEFLVEQEMSPWVCSKGDPGSRGRMGGGVGLARSSPLGARDLACVDDVPRSPPASCIPDFCMT